MSKKQRFMKHLNTGSLTFFLDGKKTRVQAGEIIECTADDLGKHLDKFTPVSGSSKATSPLKQEIQRLETIMRQGSPWLNPDYKPPVGTMIYLPTDPKGLASILADLEDDTFNASGQPAGKMSEAKVQLKAAWRNWEYQVDIDPRRRLKLKEPTSQWLKAIAGAEAQMNILKANIATIKKLIAAAQEREQQATETLATGRKFAGSAKLHKNQYATMDGRKVIYKDDKPHFADDGMSIEDYLVLCKEHKAKKQEAQKQRQQTTTQRQRSV